MNYITNSSTFPSLGHAYTPFIDLLNDLRNSSSALQSDAPVYNHGFVDACNGALLTGDEYLVAI